MTRLAKLDLDDCKQLEAQGFEARNIKLDDYEASCYDMNHLDELTSDLTDEHRNVIEYAMFQAQN